MIKLRIPLLALAGMLLLQGCAGDDQETVVTRTDDVRVDDEPLEGLVSVGKFVFHVIPDGPDGPEITVEPLVDEGYSEQGDSTIQQGLTSVLADASVVGPGSWNPSTHTISATVRITNEHTDDFDEPIMEVLWITPDGIDVTFQLTHGGGTGVGAWYAYADIEAPPGGENDASAKQNMAIYDPTDEPFSFAVDVLAELGVPSSEVFGDADDDRFNEEPYELAGDDCDDDSAAHNPEGQVCLEPLCTFGSELRACYDFDGDTQDGTSNDNDASASSTSFASGIEGSAIFTTATSAIQVDHDASLCPTELSIDMWIFPESLPTGSDRMGLLEKDNQYGIYLHPGGQIRCLYGLNNAVATVTATGIQAGRWNHVACTYDGYNHTLYFDGEEVGHTTRNGSVRYRTGYMLLCEEAPGGGDQFLGGMDRVRIWDYELAPYDVCIAAGRGDLC